MLKSGFDIVHPLKLEWGETGGDPNDDKGFPSPVNQFEDVILVGALALEHSGNLIYPDSLGNITFIDSVLNTPTTLYRLYTVQDRQISTATNLLSSTSTNWVDIPGMSLTTKNLGEDGFYLIWFSATVYHSSFAGDIFVRIVIDGTPVSDSERQADSIGANENFIISTQACQDSISSGTEIKVQARTNSGTANMTNRSLMVDGIPNRRVVS